MATKRKRSWFFTTIGDIQIGGFWRRLVGGGISKPTQSTFEDLCESVAFHDEVNSAAQVDTTAALKDKQGLVIAANATQAITGSDTALGSTGGTVVTQPSHLPTVNEGASTALEDMPTTDIDVSADAGVTTRNHYLVKLSSGFRTWLLTRIFKQGGTTGQVPKKNSATNYDWSWGNVNVSSEVTGTLPLNNGGTGATTAAGARTAILPTPAGNALKILRVNAGANDYELFTLTASGDLYKTTSSDSVAIGTGAKSFTVASGLSFAKGNRVRITDAADSANYMEGIVSSYSGTTLSVTVDYIGGSGTKSSWNINLGGIVPKVVHSSAMGGSVVLTTSYQNSGATYTTPNDGTIRKYLIYMQCTFKFTSDGSAGNAIIRLYNATDLLMEGQESELYCGPVKTGHTLTREARFTISHVIYVTVGPNKTLNLQAMKSYSDTVTMTVGTLRIVEIGE
jgi:hypothetical protein